MCDWTACSGAFNEIWRFVCDKFFIILSGMFALKSHFIVLSKHFQGFYHLSVTDICLGRHNVRCRGMVRRRISTSYDDMKCINCWYLITCWKYIEKSNSVNMLRLLTLHKLFRWEKDKRTLCLPCLPIKTMVDSLYHSNKYLTTPGMLCIYKSQIGAKMEDCCHIWVDANQSSLSRHDTRPGGLWISFHPTTLL